MSTVRCGQVAILRPANPPEPRQQSVQEQPIGYVSVVLATVTGIIHAGLAPAIVVGEVKPNLVLVAVVLVTALFGLEAGMVLAFVGGTIANLLVPEPLGAIPLSLLVIAVVVAAGARPLGRLVWVYPVLAVFAGSLLADVVRLLLASLVSGYVAGLPVGVMLSAAALNAVIAALLLVPARPLAARLSLGEPARR